MKDSVDIKVEAYPKCSVCDAAYVLRRFNNLTRGCGEWAWQRDCKCRRGEPVACREERAKGAE